VPDDDCRQAVLVAERFADGNATDRERRAVRKMVATVKEAGNLAAINARGAAFDANEKTAGKRFFFGSAATSAAEARAAKRREGRWTDDRYEVMLRAEEKAQADLLRCIVGLLPFRPVTLRPAWLSATAKQLAVTIYEDRTFDRLPILADALEEAGCTDADVLAHCRGPGPHVRGCWALDLILGKE
jgi:hypothetical protein